MGRFGRRPATAAGYHNFASQARLAKTELKVGFEPTTCGLRNRCSTAELLQPIQNWRLLERSGIDSPNIDATLDTGRIKIHKGREFSK